MKKALFYTKKGDKIQCNLCPNKCLILKEKTGFCRVRKNTRGNLYSLNYGKLTAVNIDPIEKKPLYHFLPGSETLSIGTFGCNFTCPYCCNWNISKEFIETENYVSSSSVVKKAKTLNTPSIAYTYNEPTIFYEYAYDTSKIAKKSNIKNIFVTNGYISPEPARKISKFLDATVVNLKGFNEKFYNQYCTGHLDSVLNAVKEYKKNKLWIEISNLTIPKRNDSKEELKEMCEWIIKNLGENTPFHLIGFFPSYKMTGESPATETSLEKARRTAVKSGLNYVYSRTKNGFDTKCPKCNSTVIERSLYNFYLTSNKLENRSCFKCGEKLPFVL
ncbi:MAG: AmmeMemoRadiSam system radical SAM enzyme [Candidatus Nanoarchaeia archaeon]|nr:AmmeMemoRadiSam system radical SAM enzyme [Candidatus Nanoarchaeia archaeon]